MNLSVYVIRIDFPKTRFEFLLEQLRTAQDVYVSKAYWVLTRLKVAATSPFGEVE